jgi:hypothetical protein
MEITCKNPECDRKGKPFTPKRAGAQFCSGRCRVAVHRARRKPAPAMHWFGIRPVLREAKRTLADQLKELARTEDGGQPKTGRRFYYLAWAPATRPTERERKLTSL